MRVRVPPSALLGNDAQQVEKLGARFLLQKHGLRIVPTNYLLIDYENVQPKSLSILEGHSFKVLIFVGAKQAKVPVDLANALQALGSNAEYVQISGSGSNALDFHIAFMLGELSKADRDARFHIISKDTGFDPLIRFLGKKGIRVQRSKQVTDIGMLRLPKVTAPAEKLDVIVRNLAARAAARPRKVKTLSNAINALFRKSLDETELAGLVSALEKQGHISIDGDKISYRLPGVS